MSYRGWMAARSLLYEEQFGVHIRASDNAKSADYKRSTDELKRQR